jgi:hypothetical protein
VASLRIGHCRKTTGHVEQHQRQNSAIIQSLYSLKILNPIHWALYRQAEEYIAFF